MGDVRRGNQVEGVCEEGVWIMMYRKKKPVDVR